MEKKPTGHNFVCHRLAFTVYSSLTGISIDDTVSKFKDSNYGEFKRYVADVVVEFLTDLQQKYNKIIDSGKIDEILDESNKKVHSIAESKVKEVFDKVGVGR